MTNEEKKQLLLTAMGGYLPYGLMADYPLFDTNRDVARLTGISEDGLVTLDVPSDFPVFDIVKDGLVPYLRPMSNMTDEEKREHYRLKEHSDWQAQNYLNSIHVDYRGLIWKGLALESPEGMYKNMSTSIL